MSIFLSMFLWVSFLRFGDNVSITFSFDTDLRIRGIQKFVNDLLDKLLIIDICVSRFDSSNKCYFTALRQLLNVDTVNQTKRELEV